MTRSSGICKLYLPVLCVNKDFPISSVSLSWRTPVINDGPQNSIKDKRTIIHSLEMITINEWRSSLTFHGKVLVYPLYIGSVQHGPHVAIWQGEVILYVERPVAHQTSRHILWNITTWLIYDTCKNLVLIDTCFSPFLPQTPTADRLWWPCSACSR